MKRVTRYSIGLIMLATAVVAFAVWAVATTQGSRWLLKSITPLTGVNFSIRKVEGRIIDHLLLTGVRLDLDRQQVEVDRIELHWKPLLLLSGTVGIRELTLTGVRIQDNTPVDDKPPALAWPQASQLTRLLDGIIERLQVTTLNYRRLQEDPLTMPSMAASVSWENGILTLKDLMAASPAGQVSGTLSAGFGRPSFAADLVLVPIEPLLEMDCLSLRLRPGKSAGTETLAADFTVIGSAGAAKLLELNGNAGMARNVFNLRRLRMTRPSQQGAITADGSLAFTGWEPLLALRVEMNALDLAPQMNMTTNFSGTLTLRGTLDNYGGNLNLTNQGVGWRTMTVAATYNGTREGLKLNPMSASILDGSLTGNLEVTWRNGFAMEGTVSGRNLNPARFDPEWKGVVNFTASGNLERDGQAPVTGKMRGVLQKSRLHGRTLTGEVQVDIDGDNLTLARLALQGKGFDLNGSGNLKQRLLLTARTTDLSKLIPQSSGKLEATAWVRWRDGYLSGAATGTGHNLTFNGTEIAVANLEARILEGADYPFEISASLRDLIHKGYGLQSVQLSAQGTLTRHDVEAMLHSKGIKARLAMAAGYDYDTGTWRGKISRFTGNDGSGSWGMKGLASFTIGREQLILTPLTLTSGMTEHVQLAADLSFKPLSGTFTAEWNDLNLARANSFLKEGNLSGSSGGKVYLDLSGTRMKLTGKVFSKAAYTGQGISIPLTHVQATIDGNEHGLIAVTEIVTAESGRATLTISSPSPLGMTLPDKWKLSAELDDIDLALLKPWLPNHTAMKGHISGSAAGTFLPGQHFVLNGNAALSGGTFLLTRPEGQLNISFTSAIASWVWRDETLAGALSLTMTEYGQARATFQLPVPAVFPLAVNRKGRLQGSLIAKAEEKGIITTLFPAMIQDSFGELDGDISLDGTWELPKISGTLKLARSGAYLPAAGIRLKDIQVTARLEQDLIRIDSFRAVSGPGHIEGTALITLKGRQVDGYRGTISGENFQIVHFPELRALSTPKLTFEGNLHKLILRGELLLPEAQFEGASSRTAIEPSSDVIMEGRELPAAKGFPMVLDAQIRVRLGERVFVKMEGIDAKLGGAIDLSFDNLDSISSAGEIRVVKGSYRTYGVNLEIVRGRLFFAGGPMDSPAIDVLALRTIGDVRAGVTVTGTLQRPITKLYSKPVMADVDILSYIVLGHPLGSKGQEASILAQAAGALLTSGQAVDIQKKIKNYLGLSTFEIQSGEGGRATTTGYKPIQSYGAVPATRESGVAETILTVGKYLNPQVYISYGKSLHSGSNLFRLRYDINKHWQIETQTGNESGADLFYKLEFR